MFKVILNLLLNFQKFQKFEMENLVPKLCFFVSRSSESWLHHKELTIKPETEFGFTPLENH